MVAKYPEYKNLNLPEIGDEILKYWEEHKIFESSIENRKGGPGFTFYEGPPSANGMPGIHHVMARAIKDIFCRYKTLKGFVVKRKGGWDTHGLPVELAVEKELGITKEDIGAKISIADYNQKCKEAVMKYTAEWSSVTEKMGYWVDMDNPYITYENKYIESVWWLLGQLYKKKLLYQGYSVQPYSPKAGTGLSSHELNLPGCYKDIKDQTCVAQFKIINNDVANKLYDNRAGDQDVCFLAWTTTPWTLPSNTALCVGPNIKYVRVLTRNKYTGTEVYIVCAQALLEGLMEGVEMLDEPVGFLGSDLVGMRYEQLLPYVQPMDNPENAFQVISGSFVTTEDGTGIVHIAPTFGADDMFVAREAGVPPMLLPDDEGNPAPLVDLQGRFVKQMGELAGKYVKNEYYDDGQAPEKSVDVEIVIKLKEENKCFHTEKYTHNYPHCWRTDKPILYYPLDSWFVKASAAKERMSELNDSINWKPASTGTGRFGEWLSNLHDWNLSRSRYWGIPLPIWRTEDGKEEICIESVEQFKLECEKAVKAGAMKESPLSDFVPNDFSAGNYNTFDLHRPFVDEIVLVSNSGEHMHRETDLIDVWFDSGSMPYAQVHYPFENKEDIDEGKAFPADYIAEGVDQTRGWFYTLHAIATMCFDSVAYKNVISNGLVLDKEGLKMSKRLGNAADPFEILKQYGPDATRWYMITNAQPWDNLKFDRVGIEEARRKFFGTLYNSYAFFALYANIDCFTNQEEQIPIHKRPEIDRWILSRLNSLIQDIESFY
ncbi:MAG TPA: isoleucine--tRNA ligase, partial [Flavobacteriales bacterium]|nr:isoleucine--tRNA ligase [Flavobacteriales bacterium]